jgi:hypothetical protein
MSLRMLAPIVLALTLSSAYADPTANKKTVVDFYEKAINQKDFDAARGTSARATSSTTRLRPMARRA